MRSSTVMLLSLLLLSGCGPALSESDLGTVVFEVPEVPGAEAYSMPQLGPSEDADQGQDHFDGPALPPRVKPLG